MPDDASCFANIEGIRVRRPPYLGHGGCGATFAGRIRLADVTFHNPCQLIDANVDIVTISKRLGHAKADITLRMYAHLFRKDHSKAAAVSAALR